MENKYLIASFVLLVGFLLFILRNLHRAKLPPRYAGMWIAFSAFVLLVAVVPHFVQFVSKTIFGFADATNLIYVIVIGIHSVFIFVLTLHLVRVSDKLQILISRVAITESATQGETVPAVVAEGEPRGR